MSATDRVRVVSWTLISLVVMAALAGWLVWGRDPSSLAWLVAVPGIAEGSAVGKRATYKKEAADA